MTMVSNVCDQERLSQSLRDEDLINGAAGRRADVDRVLALKELLRRRASGRTPLLAELVKDGGAPAELRTTAALALGKEPSAAAEEALIAALQGREPLVARRAAESLGRIGDRRALDALGRISVDLRGAAGRGVAFARTLISYRLGIGSHRLAAPPASELLQVDAAHGVVLKFEPVAPEAFRSASASLQEALPAIPVSEQGSVRVKCRSEHLWIVVAKEVATAGLRRLSERDGVAAVVLKESACPEGWYVYEYILGHAAGPQRLALFGVRPSGETVHFGEAGLEAEDAAVRLQALNTPYVPPISFEANVAAGGRGLVMTRATVAAVPAEKRRRPSAPSRQAS
jgi:hypothetical protein